MKDLKAEAASREESVIEDMDNPHFQGAHERDKQLELHLVAAETVSNWQRHSNNCRRDWLVHNNRANMH